MRFVVQLKEQEQIGVDGEKSMDTEKETQLKRFKIIEPFLRKEKKLKDIEKESNISYATLKRWIKAYKEKGVLGLDKKEREDKNSFRAIDDTGINIIKKIYKDSDETNISKLYDRCKEYLKEKEYNISYPTFYRIVSNLDGFFKKTSRLHIKKIKKEHEVYAAIEVALYILVKGKENILKVPKLLVIFDVATLEIINYEVYYENYSIYNILGFLREALLKVFAVNMEFIKPKEILVSSESFGNRELIKKIYDETGIKILEYRSEEKKIDEFIDFLREDIYKVYVANNKEINVQTIENFIQSYIYLDSGRYSHNIDVSFLEQREMCRELDIFLQSAKRKVSFSSLRFKNIIYKSDVLKEFNGEEIEIKYNPSNLEKIYVFKNNKFYGFIYKSQIEE